LALPVQHQRRGVRASHDRGHDLPAASHVQAKTLLDEHPLDSGAREGLRGEDHACVRPPRGQPVAERASALPQRRLVDHHDRRPDLGGHVVESAAAHDEHAVGVQGGAWWEQTQQLLGLGRGHCSTFLMAGSPNVLDCWDRGGPDDASSCRSWVRA